MRSRSVLLLLALVTFALVFCSQIPLKSPERIVPKPRHPSRTLISSSSKGLAQPQEPLPPKWEDKRGPTASQPDFPSHAGTLAPTLAPRLQPRTPRPRNHVVLTRHDPRVPPECAGGVFHWSSTQPKYGLCTHGYGDVVSSFFLRDGFWRDCQPLPPLLARLQKGFDVKNPTVVDVGANIGSCAVWLAVSNHAKVFAFEPMSLNLEMLRVSIQFNGLEDDIVLIPSGAADINSSQVLYSEHGNLGNSVIMRSSQNHGPAQQDVLKRARQWGTQTITTQLIDDTVKEHVHLMKLDCQGCEYKALLGARALLKTHGVDIVRTEFDPSFLRAQGDSPLSLLELLWEHQFTIYDGMNQHLITREGAAQFIEQKEKQATDLVAISKGILLRNDITWDDVIH